MSVVRTLHCTVSASRMHELPIDSVRQLKLDRCTSRDSLRLNLMKVKVVSPSRRSSQTGDVGVLFLRGE